MSTAASNSVTAVARQIRRWLADSQLLAPGDVAVLAGSLAAGLGNAASDVDVYVVRPHTPGDLEGQQFFVAGWRVDCHEVTLTSLRDAIDALTAAAFTNAAPPADLVTLVYRVTSGLPLSDSPVDPALVARGSAAVREALLATSRSEVVRLWWLLTVASALREFDAFQAIGADLVEAALYGSLAAAGSIYPNQKWNWEKALGLEDPEPMLAAVRRLHTAVSDSWSTALPTATVQDLLAALNVTVELASPPVYPRRTDLRGIYLIGTARYVVRHDHVFAVSASASRLLALADGASTIEEILDVLHSEYGMSRARLEEDARRALCLLKMCGLMTMEPAPRAATPLRSDDPGQGLFEAEVTPLGQTAVVLRHKLGVWSNWVDYLSRRDDLAGAVRAGQRGAAVAAAREMTRRLALIRLHHGGVVVTEGEEIAQVRHHLGEENHLAREIATLTRMTPVAPVAVDGLGERLDALETSLLEDVSLVLQGNLREEEGHGALFLHLRQLLEMARQVGVELPVSPMMIEKSQRYGGGVDTRRTLKDPLRR